ncbi:hypothetical protein FOG48_03142 [Hanseniaspora uvarum]|nr:hypothetical protein FOG48_03142 [Hanseniaspora uvarum]
MESNNPLSLYTISSFVILNDKGRRVYNRYYTNPFIKYEQYEKSKETGTNSSSTDVSLNKKKQVEYERIVYKKIKEQHISHNKDIELLVLDTKTIIYQKINDLYFVMQSHSSSQNTNEILLQAVFEGIIKSLDLLLEGSIDLATILDNYDLLSLVVDEAIDDGIVLQFDESCIVNRITLMTEDEGQINLNNIAEKGFKSAWGFAKNRFSL